MHYVIKFEIERQNISYSGDAVGETDLNGEGSRSGGQVACRAGDPDETQLEAAGSNCLALLHKTF